MSRRTTVHRLPTPVSEPVDKTRIRPCVTKGVPVGFSIVVGRESDPSVHKCVRRAIYTPGPCIQSTFENVDSVM